MQLTDNLMSTYVNLCKELSRCHSFVFMCLFLNKKDEVSIGAITDKANLKIFDSQ